MFGDRSFYLCSPSLRVWAWQSRISSMRRFRLGLQQYTAALVPTTAELHNVTAARVKE